MPRNYKMEQSKASYTAKEELLSSEFEKVEPVAFYRDIFPSGTLQKKGVLTEGVGNAIFRYEPDKSDYEALRDKIIDRYGEAIKSDGFGYLLPTDSKTFKALDKLDKMWHAGDYADDSKPIRKTVKVSRHGKDVTITAKYDRLLHDDLAELKTTEGKAFAIMPPISYFGKKANAKNASYIHALVIDLDGVSVGNLRYIISHIVRKSVLFCSPTYIVNSGHGLHLYYLLDKPIACFNYVRKPITDLKNAMAKLLWNKYTSEFEDRDFQQWGQAYRVVGSQSKLGVGYPVTAYKTGGRVSLEEINKYLHPCDRISLPLESYRPKGVTGKTLDECKELYPDWYERKVLGNIPVSDKKIFPWLYEKAKDDTKFYAKVGSRYHSLCILFATASRCRIPFDEVYEEAEGRIEFYNRFVDEDDEVNKFTIDDVVCASKFYDPAFPKWTTLDYYEKILGIKVKRNKRNGRTREQHLTKYLPYLRESGEIKDTRFGVEGGNKRGTRLGAKDKTVRSRTADSAEQVVRDYLSANPSARTSEIIRDTKLCKTTVCKWLRKIKGIDT